MVAFVKNDCFIGLQCYIIIQRSQRAYAVANGQGALQFEFIFQHKLLLFFFYSEYRSYSTSSVRPFAIYSWSFSPQHYSEVQTWSCSPGMLLFCQPSLSFTPTRPPLSWSLIPVKDFQIVSFCNLGFIHFLSGWERSKLRLHDVVQLSICKWRKRRHLSCATNDSKCNCFDRDWGERWRIIKSEEGKKAESLFIAWTMPNLCE